MKRLIKSCLLQNNFFLNQILKCLLITFLHIVHSGLKAQVANYINNGSFEIVHTCQGPGGNIDGRVKYWGSIDSSSYAGGYLSYCNNAIPLNGNTYQFPKTGKAHMITNFFCPNFCTRGYPRNRLKTTLKNGKVYCVKFYVNISNNSPRGIDGFGTYFGDSSIDTIKKCNGPITYLTPQVKNPIGNVITDTLNWVPITGTFVANGTEKYMLLGNFLSDNATTTASINTPYFPQNWTDLLIDDVSCIEYDAPAYAGPDKSIKLGDSTYIGRELDFAIDTGCVWYKLPNLTPIDTVSGLWVKPITTTTYVVRQHIECSAIKWDTVVVRMNFVGLNDLRFMNADLRIYPNPATDNLELKIENEELSIEQLKIVILNMLGQPIREQVLEFKNGKATINTSELKSGVYLLTLKSGNLQSVSKRFVVGR